MQSDLVVESIQSRSRSMKRTANLAVLGYAGVHASLFGYMRYKEKSGNMGNFEQWVSARTFMRRAKFVVALGWIAFQPYNHYWYLNELKELAVYEYMTKRARLMTHMNLAKRMWSYSVARS